MQRPPKRRKLYKDNDDTVRRPNLHSSTKSGTSTSKLRTDETAIRLNGRARAALSTREADESSSSEDSDSDRVYGGSYNALLKTFGRFASQSKNQTQGPRALNGGSGHVRKHVDGDSQVDSTEEPESNEEPMNELLLHIGETEDAEAENLADPFEAHFNDPDEDSLARLVSDAKGGKWKIEKLPSNTTGKSSMWLPDASDAGILMAKSASRSLDGAHLKKRLTRTSAKAFSQLDDVQSEILPVLFKYCDLLYGARSVRKAKSVRNLVCLHALNHVFKTRDRIIKNSARLSKSQDIADFDLRDQGFTRPKILVLLETRQMCGRYIEAMVALCEPEQQENKKQFQDAFTQKEENNSDKPADFRELFEGNNDNDFRLGVKFTRKTMKYFTQFYSSDIIFASPLGLRRAIKSDDLSKADHDFLSSIEMLIIDQADAMLMQNWEHVEFILDRLNLQPNETHGCDFSRVRRWYLDQNARHLRQSIVLSAYLTPELNSLFSQHMNNVAGKVKTQARYTGSMLDIPVPVRQTFFRLSSTSPASEPDDRFEHFAGSILPPLTKSAEQCAGTLVFIASYLDFVRVRNHLRASSDLPATFTSISEYTSTQDANRARSLFANGTHPILLYTGRAHHFRRYARFRGVRRVVLYSLPANPAFYSELVGEFLGGEITAGRLPLGDAQVKAVFSPWEALALERIVGSKRVGRMAKQGGGETFEFR